jgi:multiple sugar transport system substrate-binding protein
MKKREYGFVVTGVMISLLFGSLLIMGCQKEEAIVEKKTIRFTTWGSPASNQVYQDVVDAFERENPDLRVELMMLPWSDYHRKILTMVAAGSKLDVMRLAHSYFPQFMEKGALLPLDSHIDRDKGEIDLDDFYPEALRGCRADDNQLYGLPVDIAGWALFYNRGLFDEAGLPYPDETWTWETLLDMARKLTRDLDDDGIVDQYGVYVKVKMGMIELLAGQSGATILNGDNSKATFNTPEGRAVVQLLHDLIVKHKVVPPPEFRADQNVFAAQKVAMVILMRGDVTGLRETLSFDWDVGPVPKWPGKAPRALIVGGFNPWVISKNTEYPEESWRFLKYFTGKEASISMAKTGRFVPARRSVAESPVFLETSPPEHNVYFLDLIRASNKVFVPRFPRYKRLDKVFKTNFQYLMEGRTTVDECVAKIEEDINQLITEIQKEKDEAAS